MSTKQNDDAYVIEDEITRKPFKVSFEWLKTRNGKIIAVASAAVILGGSAAIAGALGTKAAHKLPVDSANHHFVNPNLYFQEYGKNVHNGLPPRRFPDGGRHDDVVHPAPFGPPQVHVKPNNKQTIIPAPKPTITSNH
jgi:hypothetical protein